MQNETNSKIGLSQVFQLLGIVVCGFLTFGGLSLIFKGNMGVTLFLTALSVVVPYLLVDYLQKWKTRRRGNKDLQRHSAETALLLFYLVLFLVLFIIDFHYIYIDIFNRNEVKKAGLQKVENVQHLKQSYSDAIEKERNNLAADVNTIDMNVANGGSRDAAVAELNNLKSRYGVEIAPFNFGDPGSKMAAIEEAQQVMKANYLTKDLKALDVIMDGLLKKAQKTFNDWDTKKIAYEFVNVGQLGNRYFELAQKNMPGFSFTPENVQNVSIQDPVHSLRFAAVLKIVLVLAGLCLVHLLILAPWLSAKRSYTGTVENRGTYTNHGDISGMIKQN